jgi:hypothetical protein
MFPWPTFYTENKHLTQPCVIPWRYRKHVSSCSHASTLVWPTSYGNKSIKTGTLIYAKQHLYFISRTELQEGIRKWLSHASFAAILLSFGWTLNKCNSTYSPPRSIHGCHLLGTFLLSSPNHSLGVLLHHSWTATCAGFLATVQAPHPVEHGVACRCFLSTNRR